jgi:Xaa-Pro aminopeptidase
MKTDIDSLMQASQLEAIWVMGGGQHNPAMVYLTGGGHLTHADLIKPRGQAATLFHYPMERDEAARSGLNTRSYSNFPFSGLLKEANGDLFRAGVLRYQKMLLDTGITSGRVALYGKVEFGPTFDALKELTRLIPDIELVGYQQQDVLGAAMMTKDAAEIERIRQMGTITTRVVGDTAAFLSGHAVKDNRLVKPGGEPLTVADVKGQINLWLAEAGVENPEGTIFAIGRDAGVPHSSGNPQDFLQLGQTIVFDIFPCEQGGGYYYDFTRTWCLGYAADDVLNLYEQVKSVYRQVMDSLEVGTSFKKYQQLTCNLFQEQGHPTVLEAPETDRGYVHSLGHGLGLKVHERPFSGMTAPVDDLLIPGVVATIEPGLYYPERGMGVRLEDTFVVTADGKFEIPTPDPLDLVLPVKR